MLCDEARTLGEAHVRLLVAPGEDLVADIVWARKHHFESDVSRVRLPAAIDQRAVVAAAAAAPSALGGGYGGGDDASCKTLGFPL